MQRRLRPFTLVSLVVLAVFALLSSVSATAKPPHGPPVWGLETSLTVLPGGPMVSSQATVEIRLAVTNTSNRDAQTKVTIEWYDGERTYRLDKQNIRFDEGETVLFTERVPAASLLGSATTATGEVRTEAKVGPYRAEDTWQLEIVPSTTRALPVLTAGWVEPGAYLEGVYAQSRPIVQADVVADVDAMHAVGIDTIVIAYSEYIANGWGAFYDSDNPELLPHALGFDVVGTLLDAAEVNGQHVYVGLGRGWDVYLAYLGLGDPARVASGLEHSFEVADELWDLYGDSDAFYGWYVTHETADIAAASVLFDPLADYLRTKSPDKPVLLAPSGTPVASASTIGASAVDVFAYQDAVGAGYIGPDASCLPSCVGPHGTFTSGYAYTFNPYNRIADLEALFSLYESWHVGNDKIIWADLESWEMAGPAYSGAYPATTQRLVDQIAAEAPYVDVLSVYAWPGFFAPSDSTLEHGGQAAIDLYTGYANYYNAWLDGLDS